MNEKHDGIGNTLVYIEATIVIILFCRYRLYIADGFSPEISDIRYQYLFLVCMIFV